MSRRGSGEEPVWLFDLDNTLHNATPYIFPHINRAMRAYIERHLGLDREAANRLRMGYWERYGATLLGLIRHHATDPQHFLWETHQFDDLKGMLVFDPAIRNMLRRLPGRKILFSNAPAHYAEAVVQLMGIRPCFSAIYPIEKTHFQPKPMAAGFRALLRAERLQARDCIMVEDSLANLVTAKRLGMRTVWVSTNYRASPWVDVKIRHIATLPSRLGQL